MISNLLRVLLIQENLDLNVKMMFKLLSYSKVYYSYRFVVITHVYLFSFFTNYDGRKQGADAI